MRQNLGIRVLVHCKTQDEATDFCKGRRWVSGQKMEGNTRWSENKEHTVYYITGTGNCEVNSKDFYTTYGDMYGEILEYSDLRASSDIRAEDLLNVLYQLEVNNKVSEVFGRDYLSVSEVIMNIPTEQILENLRNYKESSNKKKIIWLYLCSDGYLAESEEDAIAHCEEAVSEYNSTFYQRVCKVIP